MPFAAQLGFHADEIESSNMVSWCSEKKRRRIGSRGARSTERGHEESSLGQRDTERHIRILVANRPTTLQTAISSSGRRAMICSLVEASEQASFGIIRAGAATFTRDVS